MRAIKFRGLDMHENKWVYGLFFNSGSEGQWTEFQTENGATFYVDPDTISQYTGLKDKHGKEIYEGDITEITPVSLGEVHIGTVRMVDGSYIIHLNNKEYAMLYDTLEDNKFTLKAIGNIYENPELLDVTE